MAETKAQRILDLYDGVRTTREIAAIVGCRPEYVRVVARQRQGTSMSDIDRRYRSSSLGRATFNKYQSHRWATDPEYRRRKNESKARSMRKAGASP